MAEKEWISMLQSRLKNSKNIGALLLVGSLAFFMIIGTGADKPELQESAENGNEVLIEYSQQLENKIEDILSDIQGVGKVTVGVSLEAGAETVYAQNIKTGATGQRDEYEHVFLRQKDGDHALVEMTWEPSVRGIAVVCEGAGNIEVDTQIIEVVSVLTGATANRISIAKMN